MPTLKSPIITLCKIANAIASPRKNIQTLESKAYIFRGSEAVFFSPTLFSHSPHHPIQRCRDKKAFPFFSHCACGKIQTRMLHKLRFPLFALVSAHAQQKYVVPHTFAFFQLLIKNDAFFLLRNAKHSRTPLRIQIKNIVSTCLPRSQRTKANSRFKLKKRVEVKRRAFRD